jgi:hypothetical protein
MKFRIPSPSLVLSTVALFVAIGGGAAVAAGWTGSEQQVKHLIGQSTANNASHLGGQPASSYLQAKHFVSSGGEHFFGLGKTVVLGKAGHFTFLATCSSDTGGAQSVTFSVKANTYGGLDGNAPSAPTGAPQTIHQDSDAMNSTAQNPLNAGQFAQVGSASSSTEIAADGQEVDVFYNDGVNWPKADGSTIPCFAGYTGFLG